MAENSGTVGPAALALTGWLGCVAPAQLMVAQGPESCVELKAIVGHQELHPAQWGCADQHQEAKAREAATEHPGVGVCLIHILLPLLGWHRVLVGGKGRLQG